VAPSLLDYALDHCVTQAAAGSLETRIRSVDEVLRILQKSEHPIEREERIRVVAERLGINQQRLIERYPALLPQQQPGSSRSNALSSPTATVPVFKDVPEERDLVLLLLHGKFSPADVRRLRPDAFTVSACQKLIELALAQVEQDGRIRVRSLLDVAIDDPDCGALATDLSLREEHFDDAAAHIKDCFERLDVKRTQQDLRDLIAQLKTAEREGRVDDARMLNMQVNELRMRKAGTPTAGVVSLVKE
jgi:DNA primase